MLTELTQRTRSVSIAPSSFAFTLLLAALAGLPALSIDISAPTLVLLPSSLATTPAVAGLTLSLFMAGFAAGQFGGGAISDQRGRKPVLVTGLVAYAAAGIACALSTSGLELVLSRFVQGVAAGACSVLSFAMVQDLFEGEAARSKRVLVTVVFGVVPLFAPALGAIVTEYMGWRFVHVTLAAAGAALLLIAWFCVAESHPIPAAREARGGLRRLGRDRAFIGLAITNALSYAAIFAYVAGSPVVVMGHLGLSSRVYAVIFAGTAVSLTVGAWSSSRIVRRGVSIHRLLAVSFVVLAAATVGLSALSLAGVPSLHWLAVPLLMMMLFARGVIAPNLQHLAIERHRTRAGTASAAIGVSQLLSAAMASAAVAAMLPYFGPSALAVSMAVLATGSMAVGLWAIGSHRTP